MRLQRFMSSGYWLSQCGTSSAPNGPLYSFSLYEEISFGEDVFARLVVACGLTEIYDRALLRDKQVIQVNTIVGGINDWTIDLSSPPNLIAKVVRVSLIILRRPFRVLKTALSPVAQWVKRVLHATRTLPIFPNRYMLGVKRSISVVSRSFQRKQRTSAHARAPADVEMGNRHGPVPIDERGASPGSAVDDVLEINQVVEEFRVAAKATFKSEDNPVIQVFDGCIERWKAKRYLDSGSSLLLRRRTESSNSLLAIRL